jgi:hypothetical protein
LISEKIDSNYFDDFHTCPHIQKLEFTLEQLDETHELVPTLTQMLPFFPNLARLTCFFKAEHYATEQVDTVDLKQFRSKVELKNFRSCLCKHEKFIYGQACNNF